MSQNSAPLCIVVAEPIAEAGMEALRSAGFEVVGPKDDWKARLPEAVALIVRSGTTVDRAMLESAPRLRVVGRAGVGLDNIDIESASARGVAVVNTPGGNATAAAEHSLALLLALARHVATAHQSLSEGAWERHRFVGRELRGKRLGLFGCGRVGALVAERARAFGMEVLVLDPFLPVERARQLGLEKVEALTDLLPRCDVLSLHAPLTAETKGLMRAETLALMPAGALLINCARGGLLDEDAVAAALDSGQLGGVGLDVFLKEPPENSPLLNHAGVLHTPHLGASTVEAKDAVGLALAEGLSAILLREDFSSAVNLAWGGSELRPHLAFLDLATRVGRLQAGLLEGAPGTASVELVGEGGPSPEACASAVATGLLQVLGGAEINPINAARMAAERGLVVASAARAGEGSGRPRLLSRFRSGSEGHAVEHIVLAGLDDAGRPRIFSIDGHALDLAPEGDLLVLRNEDQPGVVGKIGTRLGEAGINIGEMRLGRSVQASDALSIWQVDQPLSQELLHSLRAEPGILDARQLQLGAARGLA